MLTALGLSAEEFGEEVSLIIAVKLFDLGRLSAGAAAALAGVPKPLFLARLADYRVDRFRLTEAELQQDIEDARGHR